MTIFDLIEELEELKERLGPDTLVVMPSGWAGRRATYSDINLRVDYITDRHSGDYVSTQRDDEDGFDVVTFDLQLPF